MRINILFAVIALGASGCSSSWKLKEAKSEMDDTVRYSVIAESEREQKNDKGETIRVPLAVTYEKNGITIRSGPGQLVRFNGGSVLSKGERAEMGTVKVRFDEDPPIQANILEMPNQNGRYVYLGPQADLLRQMVGHKMMKIEWVLEVNGTVIDTFKMEGLKDSLVKLCGKVPAACTQGTPIGGALASVGVEISGSSTSPTSAAAPGPCPTGQELREEKFQGSQAVKSRGCVSEAGKEEGVLTQWYPNGNKEFEFTYRAGVKDGPATMWHENGQKSAVGTYRDGQLEGSFSAWHPNGQQAEQHTLKAGKIEGLSTTWDPSGKKTERVFKDGRLVTADAAPGILLPNGTFTAATTEWKAARDAVLSWCGANTGKCTGDAVELLKAPADGTLSVSGDDGTLTTCSPGNCPTVSVVSFKRAGATWSITKVEAAAMGD